MKKLIVLGLTILLAFSADAFAQRGGGRSSFSSGGGGRSSFSSGGRSSFSSGGKPSIGGGGRSSFSSPSSKPTPPSSGRSSFSSKPPGGGSSFSSPGKINSTTPIPNKTPTNVNKRPMANNFDSLASKDAKKAESRINYEKSTAPAPSYKTPAGKTATLDAKDKKIEYLRGRLDQQKWVNRQQRETSFYQSYSSSPVIMYNDCYHSMWNYWLLSQSLNTMSMWVYCHQHSMDQARLNYLYSHNAELRARVAALEAQRIPRDPTYTPANVDPDMQFNDNYVNAVYNPRPKTVTVYEYSSGPSVGTVLLWIFVYIPLTCVIVGAIIYLMFVRRY